MRLKKLKRSQCVVLSLVLKRQWYDLIESGAKKVEWRRADYWLNRAYKWFRTAHINNLVPVVEFRHGYAKDSRRMAFACGWLWDRQKKLFRYCTPPYVWQNANIPVKHPQLGETPIERVAILIGERVELIGKRVELVNDRRAN
jgi:hypothetical protein